MRISRAGHGRRAGWLLALLLGLAACASDKGLPEEFPPVRLGMTNSEVRASVTRGNGATVLEQGERMLRVAGRDRRVAEEVFLFQDGRLAAWTLRYTNPASRSDIDRLTRRFNLAFGQPIEHADNGLVVSTRWKLPEGAGRVLLSGYVGGRGPQAPLMVRVEDPSVIRRLIRELRRESASGEADSLTRTEPTRR